MDYKVSFNDWLSNPKLNSEAFEELSAIKDNQKEIEYRFGCDLAFGTAGMRGIIGYGTNMINVYTVKKATKGLAEYIKSLGIIAMERGVCISYDTRKNSKLFAKVSAGVLLANGIKVRIFNEPSPVPMLSTAVRYYSAIAGIMITASHNPKEYNGYKVYGEDGAQMSIEATNEVVSYMSKIKDVFSIEEYAISSLKPQGDLKIIGKPFLKTYIKILSKLALSKKAVAKCGKKLKIVYTPLHGTGYNPVCMLFKKLGIGLNVVKEQTCYDIMTERYVQFGTKKIPNGGFRCSILLGC